MSRPAFEETMDVGLMMICASYGWEGMSDRQVWDEDLRLGFDVLWSAEHHFFDYSFCPDNLQLMTYLAAAVWGAPDRVPRELEERRGLIGDFELNASFRFGGTPYDEAEASSRLFGNEVSPVLKSRHSAAIANAA